MNSKEKTQFTHIKNSIPGFEELLKKFLTSSEEMNDEEKTYILSIAILAIKQYELERDSISYLEFAYFIILNYSLKFEDYRPLYDFSIEYGFYPISKKIIDLGLIEKNIIDVFALHNLNHFKNSHYLETLQQNNIKSTLTGNENELAFIAPTSFGKSELIIEHIKLTNEKNKKIAIVVPSKSLITQTFKLVKDNIINRKIIYHNEMFNAEDKSFIAILTQERALKILDHKHTYFDALYIDEAHNLLERDHRSILLTRLLRLNLHRNPSSQILYLSPLIGNSNNLKHRTSQEIIEKRIDMNIKIPRIIYKDFDEEYIYDRFSNNFFPTNEGSSDYISYVISKGSEKNFIYIRKPQDIEKFTKELTDSLPNIPLNPEIDIVVKCLESQVHPDYWMIETIKKGVVYLHGKLPDIVKEYLEYKFKNSPYLKYLIANHVVLEGINLPIDSMFIFNVHSLKPKHAMNLIGRVNRLNYIFENNNSNLTKLMPTIRFVESHYKGADLKKYITKLRSNIIPDHVNNPLLSNYKDVKLTEEQQIKDKEIQEIEDFILNYTDGNKIEELKNILYKNNIHHFINISPEYLRSLDDFLSSFKNNIEDIFELVHRIFFSHYDVKTKTDDLYYFKSYDFIRNNYKIHLNKYKNLTLNQYISTELSALNQHKNKIVYIGKTFGNVDINGNINGSHFENKYLDLNDKPTSELINFILTKYKLYNDFISYQFNSFIEVLNDLEVFEDDKLNDYLYGTSDKIIIQLQHLGFSRSLVNKIVSDSKINLFEFNELGILISSNELTNYLKHLNEIEQFEISKYLA